MAAACLDLAGRLRRVLPSPLVGPAVRAASAVVCLTPGRRRRIAARNAFWLIDARDVRALARATLRNLVRCHADLLTFPALDRESMCALVDMSGLPHLERARQRGRGVIVVFPHLGNCELCGSVLAALGFPMHGVVEAIDPARDALFATFRTSIGGRLIPAGPAAAFQALRALCGGGVLFIAGDRALGSSRRIVVPFGKGRRPVPIGPAWLAVQSGAPVVTAHAVLAPGRAARPYTCVIAPEVPATNLGADPVTELTRRIAARLSAVVERHPDQWFVFQPEWLGDAPAVR